MIDLCSMLEAVLFAAGEPVPVGRISLVMNVSEADVISAAKELDKVYVNDGHALRVIETAGKLQICTAPEFNSIIVKTLEHRKPPALSPSALETLAIIAYYQPATAAYVSKVRGVDSGYTISSLIEKGLIEAQGRLEAPGRPILYGTTDLFLRTMSIEKLDDLPVLPDMAASDGVLQLQTKIDAIRADRDIQMTIDDLGGSGAGDKNSANKDVLPESEADKDVLPESEANKESGVSEAS